MHFRRCLFLERNKETAWSMRYRNFEFVLNSYKDGVFLTENIKLCDTQGPRELSKIVEERNTELTRSRR